jgi:hypothetical protein
MPTIRINSTEWKTDGSGLVVFDAFVLDDEGLAVKHASVECPYTDVQDVINAPSGAEKLSELRRILKKNFTEFSDDNIANIIINNANAKQADEDFDAIVDAQTGYPYEFDLS